MLATHFLHILPHNYNNIVLLSASLLATFRLRVKLFVEFFACQCNLSACHNLAFVVATH